MLSVTRLEPNIMEIKKGYTNKITHKSLMSKFVFVPLFCFGVGLGGVFCDTKDGISRHFLANKNVYKEIFETLSMLNNIPIICFYKKPIVCNTI
jgi:hypothetical protein